MNAKLLPLGFSLCSCLIAGSVSAAPFVSSHGYSLTPAPGWQINPKHDPDDDVVIEYKQNAAAAGKPNFQVDVTPLDGPVTLETLKPTVISDYRKKFPGLVAKSQAFSSLGGVRDLDLVFIQTRDGIPLRLHQVYVLKDGLAYIFTAAYPEKTHAKYDGAVAQMLASVHWQNKESGDLTQQEPVSAAPSVSPDSFVSPHGYTITLAPGWRVAAHHDPSDDVLIQSIQYADSPEVPDMSVRVIPLSGNLTPEDLKPALVADYPKRFPGLVMKSQTYSSIGGMRDVDLVLTYPKSGFLFRLHQVCVPRNKSMYIFTLGCLEKTHAKYDATVAQLLASVHWKG